MTVLTPAGVSAPRRACALLLTYLVRATVTPGGVRTNKRPDPILRSMRNYPLTWMVTYCGLTLMFYALLHSYF